MIVFCDQDGRRVLRDEATGEICVPSCMVDLEPYVAYVHDRSGDEAAQAILRRVVAGEKLITEMIEMMRGHLYCHMRRRSCAHCHCHCHA